MGLEKIQEFILSKGYDFEVQTLNGKWQQTTDRTGQKVWYIGTQHDTDFVTFSFGDFRDPDKRFSFCTKENLSSVDQVKLDKFNKRVSEDKQIRYEITAGLVSNIYAGWEQAQIARGVTLESEYLKRKNLTTPNGVVIYPSVADNQNILVIPMRDSDGKLWNMQQIYAGGDKTFHPGARGKDCFFTFAGVGEQVLIGEGFATCLAAHLATGQTAVCAFNLSGLEGAIRETLKLGVSSANIVLLADSDGGTFKKTGKNPGMLQVKKLTAKYKVGFVVPCGPGVTDNIDFADLKAPEIRNCLAKTMYFPSISDAVFTETREKRSKTKLIEAMIEAVEHVKENAVPGPEVIVNERQLLKLSVARVGASWTPVTHAIGTRNTGFHDTIPSGKAGVKHVPNFCDLRLAFDEKNPVVTHCASEVVYAFNGKVFREVPELEMHAFADTKFDPKPKNNDCREFQGALTRFNVRDDAFFDTTKKINFQNGWLDLNTMEFRPHTPDIGFKAVLSYDFDETAVCPEFDAFLDRVLGGDPVLIQMVLEFLGYILSGDRCWTAKSLVLKGEGSNGKSTFLEVVRALVGKANILAAKVTDFKSEYVRHQLNGKLACVSEETPREALLDTSYFKDIVSGGTIGVRAIYGTPYNLEVRTKVIFSCNDMPPTGDSSLGMLRRLIIVPFNTIFTKESADPFISERLLRELPGIFVRSLSSYFSLLKRGRFEDSVIVDAAVHEYQKSTNPVWSWIDERVTVQAVNGPKGQVISSISGLFADFKMYCEASGYKVMNVENFSKAIGRVVPDAMQRRGLYGKKTDRFRGLRAVTRRDGAAFIESGRHALEF